MPPGPGAARSRRSWPTPIASCSRFLVEDRLTSQLLVAQRGRDPRAVRRSGPRRRNRGAARRTCGAAIARGRLPAIDVDYLAAAMSGIALEVGVRMAGREPPDVAGAAPLRHRARARRNRADGRRGAERARHAGPVERVSPWRARPMPSFCRHNRLLQNCSICAREQSIEAAAGGLLERTRRLPAPPGQRPPGPRARARRRGGERRGSTVRVRRLDRGGDDGYRSELAPGLKSSVEAERLRRRAGLRRPRGCELLAQRPARTCWPRSPTPRAIRRSEPGSRSSSPTSARLTGMRRSRRSGRRATPWGRLPELDGVEVGPRGGHDPAARQRRRSRRTGAWAARAGSQAAGVHAATGRGRAERRFARVFERLALPGLTRDARFELLTLARRARCRRARRREPPLRRR